VKEGLVSFGVSDRFVRVLETWSLICPLDGEDKCGAL
jgi:hypothetical protein